MDHWDKIGIVIALTMFTSCVGCFIQDDRDRIRCEPVCFPHPVSGNAPTIGGRCACDITKELR